MSFHLLEQEINKLVKKDFNVPDYSMSYAEIFEDHGATYISFLKEQHSKEFLKYHKNIIKDNNLNVVFKNLKVPDIVHKGNKISKKIMGRSDHSDDKEYLDIQEYGHINKNLEISRLFICKEIDSVHASVKKLEKFSDEWMNEMEKIAPLVEIYHSINRAIKKYGKID